MVVTIIQSSNLSNQELKLGNPPQRSFSKTHSLVLATQRNVTISVHPDPTIFLKRKGNIFIAHFQFDFGEKSSFF